MFLVWGNILGLTYTGVQLKKSIKPKNFLQEFTLEFKQ